MGRSYTGDIAIDDIHFVKGTCRGESLSFENETESGNAGRRFFSNHDIPDVTSNPCLPRVKP